METRKPRRLPPSVARGWTFITNHAQVLLAAAQRPDLRVREIASAVGITERYAYRMLSDLQDAGYVERRRVGRCNVYRIHPELAIGDPVVEERSLRGLLQLIGKSERHESPWGASSRRSASPVANVSDSTPLPKSMNERSLVARRNPS